MKNLFCRLTQATADATVTQNFGIYQNSSPCADTSTGYAVSKNQNSKKWWLLPKLAALLLLVQVFAPSITLHAQAPTVTNPWATIASDFLAGAITADANENLYIGNRNAISKVTPTAGVTQYWSFLGVTNSAALCTDASGNIYSANADNTVSKVTPSGTLTSNWATLSPGSSPRDMALDASGNLYVANSDINYISKITSAGVANNTWAEIGAGATSILTATNGDVYVSAQNPNRIDKITSAGVITTNWASIPSGLIILDMTFDANGNIFATVINNVTAVYTVCKIMPNGTINSNFATLTGATMSLKIICDDKRGVLYLINQAEKTVSKVSMIDGTLTQQWVSFSGFQTPRSGIIVGDNLFVAISALATNNIYVAKIELPSITFNQTQPTCANSTNGGLRAIPPTTCGAGFQYLWTPGGATTDTISNLAPGTYSVRVVCGTDTLNKSITLMPITVVSAPSTSNQSLCNGATVADLVATPTAGNSIVWYATATGGAALANSTPLVNATKYYAAQVTPSNCESSTRAADSVTIQATVAAKADSSYCNGSNIAVNFVGASGNTYNWTATQNGTGIAASGTGNTSFTGVNNTNAVVTDTVMVSSSFNTCTPQRDTFAISVLPTPLVDSIANMQVCPGTTVPAINFTTPITGGTVGYKWTNSNTAIGLAASGFGNIPSFTAAATAQSSTISVTPYMLKSATDTCFGTARTFNIAADLPAAPTTTGNLVVYTGTKTISQLAITPLAGGSLNYFYEATGGTALAASTTVVDDTTYYVTQTVAGCESNPRKQIKVNRIAADSIVLCSPATVAGLTATPQAGNTAKWFDVPTGGTALANTTALAVGQDTLYVEEGNSSAQLSLHSYSPNNPSSTINAFTIGENDTIYYGVFQDSAKIFRINPDGTGATIISSGGPNESIRFMQYESDVTGHYILYTTENTVKRRNLNTGVVTTIWTSPTPPAFNLRQVSRDVANNKLYVADAEFGRIKLVDLSNNSAITVDSLPNAQFGSSSFPRRPFSVCYVAPNSLYIGDFTRNKVFLKNLTTGVKTDSISFNNPTTISLLPNGKLMIVGGDRIITTNQDLTGSTNLVTSISSANSAKYNSIGELVYTDYRTIKKISSIQSNRVPVTVIVNPKPIVTATIDKVVCNNSTVSAVNFSTTTIGGTVTYAWTNNKTSIGLAASGTGDIASFTAINNGTAPDTATIIVTPTINNLGLSCEGIKDTFLIIVNPTAAVNTVSNQVVCNGSAVTSINFGTTNTGGTVTYAWTNNTTSIGLAASGTGNIATFNGVNNGTSPVTATITVTPTFTNGGVSCAGPTKTFTITVNPTVTVNPENDQVVCNGAGSTAINFSTTATGGTTTYTWTNNKPTNGLAASGTGNIASFTAVNNGTAPDTATIIVTPTFANGGTNCVGTKDTIYVVVNPTAKINAIADKVECNGSVVVATMPTSTATGGTVTYTWTNNTTSIGLGASGTGAIPSFTATNTGSTAITSTIIVTPTYTNGGVSCVGTNDTFNITINPPPIFAATTDKYVCNASTTTAVVFTTALTGGTAVYHWTNNNTAIGLAASGTGNVPSFTATNTTTAPIMGSIVVYMDYTNAGLTCTSLRDTFNYVVNPTAVVNPINDQVLCNGSTTAAISFSTTATGGILTYNWTNNNTSFGLAASGTGNIASFNAINNTNAPQIATITVTPVFSNGGVSCTGTATSFTITVNPEMIVNAISSQVLCNNASTTAVNFASPTTGGTIVYNWTNSNTAIGLAASGSGNIASFTATNSSNAPISGTITVIATYTNAGISCTSAPQTFAYTVNPTATVNAINNQAVCNGAAVSAVNFATTATGGTVTYAWTNSNSSIGLAVSGTGNIASFTATNSSNAAVTAAITVTPTFTNGGVSCTGTAQSFTVTVNPTAVVNAVSNQTLCAGSTNSAVTFSSPVAGTTYSWTNSNPSIGLAASGTGNVPSFVAVNPNPNAVIATITVTPNTAAGCIGQAITYAITVNGLSVAPTAINNPTPIVCANNAFTTLSVNGGALGSGAVWKWYADSLNTVSIGSGATLSNIPVAKTTTYFVRAEGTCNNTAAASVVVQRANLVSHVRQHWSDVLLFDNSSKNYVAWQWYKNGVAVNGATLQQYSESSALVGTYYVVATDRNGLQTISCPLTVTAGSFTGLRISLFPNPADKGANVKVATNFTTAELQGASLTISDVFGRVVSQLTQVSPLTNIQAPTATGMYIVTLTLQNGMKYSTNLLTK